MQSGRKILVAAIIYALWISFYLACSYFNFLSLPANISSWVFMGVGVVCIVIIAVRVEELKYSPFILMVLFILSGRAIGFTADYISLSATGNALFRFPFGSIDFFLFHLLGLGLMRYMPLVLAEAKPAAFHPAALIPLVLFTVPVVFNLLPAGLTAETVYSFIFTAVAVLSMAAAILFWLNNRERARFAWAIGLAVILDILVYFEFSPIAAWLPPGLNFMLMPFALFMLTHAASAIKKDDIND